MLISTDKIKKAIEQCATIDDIIQLLAQEEQAQKETLQEIERNELYNHIVDEMSDYLIHNVDNLEDDDILSAVETAVRYILENLR